jgi:hypothetical protein
MRHPLRKLFVRHSLRPQPSRSAQMLLRSADISRIDTTQQQHDRTNKQTNNSPKTTQVQHLQPTNNIPNPQLVTATLPEHLAQAPVSHLLIPHPRRFQIEQPHQKRLHSFPRILQAPVAATSSFPALLRSFPRSLPCFPFLSPFSHSFSTQTSSHNITMVGTRKRRAEESEEEELQSLPEDSEEEEE